MKRSLGWVLLVVMAAALGACATGGEPQPTLYKRLGGREGIRKVVDDFTAALVADPRVSARFTKMKPAEVEKFKSHAADQICEATGGPCAYLGKDMKTAHKGMNITDAEWDASIEDLVKVLDADRVPKKEQQELIGLLATMKKDVIGQ